MFGQDYSEDEGEISSSEDELEKYIKEKYEIEEEGDDSDDDFEAEMESQLESRVRFLEQTTILKKAPISVAESIRSTTPKKQPKKSGMIHYDQDSDESDTEAAGQSKIDPCDEDPLYDPDQDDKDQAWMDKKRQSYLQPISQDMLAGKKLRSSDAALNCPGCMTLLCMDCQRHEIYHTQYRAMFVMNCEVDKNETVEARENASSRKRRRMRGGRRADVKEDVYHPVKCAICGTEVAAYDSEEIYHFHNIIASHT